MSDEVKPALTPEEWRKGFFERDGVGLGGFSATRRDGGYVLNATHCGCDIDGEHNHAIAAVCLMGQPFGFTREMVAVLKRLAHSDLYDQVADDGDGHIDTWCSSEREVDRAHLWAVIQRIEALLPPETK